MLLVLGYCSSGSMTWSNAHHCYSCICRPKEEARHRAWSFTGGQEKPLSLSAAASHRVKEQSHSSENPNTTNNSYVGLTNSEGALGRETQATSPKGILKALTNCAVHLLLSISSGGFLHRKALCILPYQNKITIMLKTSKQTKKPNNKTT